MSLIATLPRDGIAREALRKKGQFWTPPWVAEAMAAYVLAGGAKSVFDPAVGAGAFFLAVKKIIRDEGKTIALAGTELDPTALAKAVENGLSKLDLDGVELRDFVLDPPSSTYPAIVANPPYLRHHRLSSSTKQFLRLLGSEVLGEPLDGRTGYHVYFLLRSLMLLQENGRLCFIVPADTCEGISSKKLWLWISTHYRIDRVVTFAPDATPFPDVDTNPLILCITREPAKAEISWAVCNKAETPQLKEWLQFGLADSRDLQVFFRKIPEALETGVSRPPIIPSKGGLVLGNFADVVRGIATGANQYFLFTKERAREMRIPSQFLRRTVGRTRDVENDELFEEDLDRLDSKDRPTLLLYLDRRPLREFPQEVLSYLLEGERMGLPRKPLISTRTPWYRMEQRSPPPFLFTYLGRRNCRFIRNRAKALPLTSFLCVYPRNGCDEEQLWKILSHPDTSKGLSHVGKSYGGGAIKVEPRALETLPIPPTATSLAGFPSRNEREDARHVFRSTQESSLTSY